ncbi:MAG: CarD family transcriptional regulator, partial [Clostridia bacterium]|nr:CarD family transcriptional regulator [Clostridia bacterium]
MYCVGDKVVHPMHGAGTIEEIKEMEIVGVKRQYYVVRFAIGNMVTNVPIESADSIDIRPVIDKGEA